MKLNVYTKMKSVNQIITEHGLQKDGRVETYLRDEVDRYCDDYVPMDKGILKKNKSYPNNHSIKYIQPYAHYMYIGKKAIGASRPAGVKRKISGMSLKYQGAPKRRSKMGKKNGKR